MAQSLRTAHGIFTFKKTYDLQKKSARTMDKKANCKTLCGKYSVISVSGIEKHYNVINVTAYYSKKH
jgi:hypothetical protein